MEKKKRKAVGVKAKTPKETEGIDVQSGGGRCEGERDV